MISGNPIMSFRAFLDSGITYVLPAPGGALADGGTMTNKDSDAYMAALASKAKRRIVETCSIEEYLGRHLVVVRDAQAPLFSPEEDAKIIERIGAWIGELAN